MLTVKIVKLGTVSLVTLFYFVFSLLKLLIKLNHLRLEDCFPVSFLVPRSLQFGPKLS